MGGAVQNGTASSATPQYTGLMQTKYTKTLLTIGWALAICLVGLALDVTHASAWTVLAGFCVVPPILLLWLGRGRQQTLSESIRNELR